MTSIIEDGSLSHLLRRQARDRPAAKALIFGDRVTSYAELDRHASRTAAGLVAMGVRVDERIGYLGKNSDHYFSLLFGAVRAGAVLVPVNWRLAVPEIATILADAEVTRLFVGPGFGEVATAAAERHAVDCVSIDGANSAWPDHAGWRDAQSPEVADVATETGRTVLQMYTSGTTGTPKGVELLERNLIGSAFAASQAGWGAWGPNDVILACLPAFHIAGTGSVLFSLLGGAQVVILEEANATAIVQSIPRYGITCTVLVPALISSVVQHALANGGDFGTLRSLSYGASPIAEELIKQARLVFSNASFWQLYGLTESGGSAAAVLPPEMHDPLLGKLRSCGKPPPGSSVRIVDPAGATLAAGQVGELVMQSPGTMKGYWRNPEATRSALSDGWLRTGDAALMDEDGFVFIQDRIKDMIITGGENVYPAEVENALFGHPAIAEVAVIGVPDPRWGEAVKAVVVLHSEGVATEAELIAYARERIAGYKLPKSVDFVEALPRSAAGKVLKWELRKPYWDGVGRQVG